MFEKVFELSLISSYAIAVILIIRFFLNKCERKYSFYLWFVVFLNLIFPVSVQGPFSLIPKVLTDSVGLQMEYLTENAGQPHVEETHASGGFETAENMIDQTIGADVTERNPIEAGTIGSDIQKKEQSQWLVVGNMKEAEETETEKETITFLGAEETEEPQIHVKENQPVQAQGYNSVNAIQPLTIAGYLWVLGIWGVWSINLFKGIALSRKLRKCREGKEISAEGVICTEDISAPFLWGIRKPLIYLPANIEEAERIYVIAHESFHRSRLDYITKPVVFAIVTIHWFNPLVWLAYALFVQDMEISCDEAVLSHMGKDIKKLYAASLLKYAAGQNGFILAPLTFGEPSLKSRIENVMGYKKRGMAVTVVALCVATLTACGLVMRPSTEEYDAKEVVQEVQTTVTPMETASPENTEVPKNTVSPETTSNPESTKAPDSETETPKHSAYSSYSVYFQDILQAKFGEGNRAYQVIEAVESGVKFSTVENVAAYQEPQPAYHATEDFCLEDGGIARIDWLKLSENNILENLTFDMSNRMKTSGFEHATIHDLFYDEDTARGYIVICSIGSNVDIDAGREDRTWLICFSLQDPMEYEIYAYEYAVRFGESCKSENFIFLHGGASDIPYIIDLDTMKGRLSTSEYTASRAATYELAAEYMKKNGTGLHVCWMNVLGKYKDVELYSGRLMETMDTSYKEAEVYVAGRAGEILETMVVRKNGVVTIMKGLKQNAPLTPLEQSEIDWFNESFFNQGYLQEEESAMKHIRNQFLTHEYATSKDINIDEVFYNGSGEAMTEDDWLCVFGEARLENPLYRDMVPLTEEEYEEIASYGVDVDKMSKETMDKVMRMYTGIGIEENEQWSMEGRLYNKRDNVYYTFHGDTNTVGVHVIGGHYNVDGTLTLYYSYGRNAEQEDYMVVLRPTETGYHFISNLRYKGSSLPLMVEEKMYLSGYAEHFARIIQECAEQENYRTTTGVLANLSGTDRMKDSVFGHVSADSDYQYQISFLQLEDETVWEKLSFDFKDVMLKNGLTDMGANVYLDEETERGYIVLTEDGVEQGDAVIGAFSTKNPKSYEVHYYQDIVGRYGYSEIRDNKLCTRIADETTPYLIDLQTWEVRSCEQELKDIYKLAEELTKNRWKNLNNSPTIWDFMYSGRRDDADIYYAMISEAPDIRPMACIYTAYKDNVYLGAIMIEMETGIIYYSEEQSEKAFPCSLITVENKPYNVILDISGKKYCFKLDMDTENLYLRLGESVGPEEAIAYHLRFAESGESIVPVYVSDGKSELFLGEIMGSRLYGCSDTFVDREGLLEEHLSAESISYFLGVVEEITGDYITIWQCHDFAGNMMECDPATVNYPLAETIEYYIYEHDKYIYVTPKYFLKQLAENSDVIYRFTVAEGKVWKVSESGRELKKGAS